MFENTYNSVRWKLHTSSANSFQLRDYRMTGNRKKQKGLTVGQKLILIIGLPLMLQLAISFGIAWLLDQTSRLASYEYHSKEVISRINWLGYMAAGTINNWVGRALQSADRSAAASASREPSYESIYLEARLKMKDEIPHLSALFSPKTEQLKNVDDLKRIIHSVEQKLDEIDKASELSPTDRVKQLFQSDAVRYFWAEFPAVRTALLTGERSPFKTSHLDVETTRNQLKMAILLGAGANIMMALAVTSIFALGLALRIRVLTNNTRRLAESKELQPPLGGSDEIAELDETFHSMANALKQARHKERAIFENTADIICVLSAEGEFTEASPATRSAWGFDPRQLLGRTWTDFIAEEDRQQAANFLDEAKMSQTPVARDLIIIHVDGHPVDFRWSGSWSEEHQALFCVAHDVSEQKKLEKLKREFVQLVSHDLRSPLTAIQGFLDMVQSGVYGAVPNQVTDKARKSSMDAERLISLINNLLDMEKLEAGRMELLLGQTKADCIIDRAVASIESLAEMSNVTLMTTAKPVPIYCDDMQIVQVLVNLLSNAIKFSPEGGKVTVEAEQVENTVEFRVSDQGRGIPPEFLESIFDRFKQVRAEDGRVKRGTGLGLAICKAIIDAHNGEIGVRSEVGKGTSFWFRLPGETEPSCRQAKP